LDPRRNVDRSEAVLPDPFEGGRELLADPFFAGKVKRQTIHQRKVGRAPKSGRRFLPERNRERRVE
jgi:hypothetical protein